MIIIKKPELQIEADWAIISVIFIMEGKEERLWYKIPVKFRKFLVTENVDAFLVGLLFLGLKTGNDIILESPVSERLHYTLNHYVIKALCLANPLLKPIKIHAVDLNSMSLNISGFAGTGLSCGVDSLATYYDHIGEKGQFNIEYFTYCNAGSHGDFGGANSRKIFFERLNSVKKFADYEDKDIIAIDSNISEILKMNFQQTHTFRNISCILNLQKLFKNYYYASGYRFDYFRLNKDVTSDADILYLSMLSTESLDLFSSVNYMNRRERTEFISKFPKTYSTLDVCTNPLQANKFKNCSSCEKCMRTALTLQLLDKLHYYKEVFDIEIFLKQKDKFIGQLVINRNLNESNKDLYNFLKKENAFILKHFLEALKYKITQSKNALKKKCSL